ncbi:MAG TPA: hypothetical protein VKA60_21735 [Blastocatellia bacterium]|nr:hypothetical protein [Blastocatellia bacterium]
MNRDRSHRLTAVLLIVFALLLPLCTACQSRQEKARKAVEAQLQSQGITARDMTVDFFHPGQSTPDKAYIAVTVTYNFATAEGNFQKEYLGYILKQNGQSWTVENGAAYTKDQARAEAILGGGK